MCIDTTAIKWLWHWNHAHYAFCILQLIQRDKKQKFHSINYILVTCKRQDRSVPVNNNRELKKEEKYNQNRKRTEEWKNECISFYHICLVHMGTTFVKPGAESVEYCSTVQHYNIVVCCQKCLCAINILHNLKSDTLRPLPENTSF